MRDYKLEVEKRVGFIKDILEKAGAKGIVYGNSGGKDCTLVGILCKMATDNILSVIMPCQSKQNYKSDKEDALLTCEQFGIPHIIVDLTKAKETLIESLPEITTSASVNIAPRLRMTTLYAIAQTKNYLVCGTGNASEAYMGYFTKWGDGAYDLNPIADLTVTEIFDFLRYLNAPSSIIEKAPSAGLFEGQTDEAEMGITYKEIDFYIKTGDCAKKEIIEKAHKISEHKRNMPHCYM
jgi:NAD+ synthase